jgi:hypothetical protein
MTPHDTQRKVDMPPHDTQRLCTITEEYGQSTQSDVCCAVSVFVLVTVQDRQRGRFPRTRGKNTTEWR